MRLLNKELNITSKNNEISKHITALITFFALLPLVYFLPDFIEQFLPAIKWLNVVAVVGVILPIISYVMIPIAHYFLSR